MSVEIIKKEIARFLNCETPEVMAIKGKWGTGKTYTWNEFLKESQQNKQIKLKTYSYVSLFGINSLEEFKYAVFKNSVDKELIDKGVSVDSLLNNIDSLSKHLGKKSLSVFEGFSRLFTRTSLTTTLESIAFVSINKKIICIDDLERRGKNLDIKDILGLISVLKEQKKCKIVLLLNDGEEGLEDYTKYREKVIDIELEFAPTVEENVGIAFKDNDSYAIQVLKESAIKLNIKNIRILKQIERLVNLVMDCLGTDYEPEITHQVASSLTLFAWCYYCHKSDNVPPLDYITQQGIYTRKPIDWRKFETSNNSDLNEKENNKEEKEKYEKWDVLINNCGYKGTNDFSFVLANVVKTGYCIESEIRTQADNKNNEIKSHNFNKSYREAWNFFYSGFEDNTDAVVQFFYTTLHDNIDFFTLNHLDVFVNLLRDFGENYKANDIIDSYFELRKSYLSSFSLSSYEGKNIKDKYIFDKFNETSQEISVIQETDKQVLERILKQIIWSYNDKIILSNTTVEQYTDLFKSIKNNIQGYSIINTCLEFGRFSNTDNEDNEIYSKTIEALKRIAGESKINKLRIKYNFKIEID